MKFCPLLAVLTALVLAPSAFSAIRLVSPQPGEKLQLAREGQRAFLDLPRAERRAIFSDKEKRRALAKVGWYPEEVTFRWTGADAGARLELFRQGECVVATNVVGGEVRLTNLEVARDYVWRVSAGGQQAEGRFSTLDGYPRFLRIGGLYNTRDIGGYVGLGGKRVRQNLVLRSGGLNGNAYTEFYTREELERMDTDGKVKAREAELNALVEQFRAYAAQPATAKLRDVKMSHSWKVTYEDGRTETIRTNDKGCYDFPANTDGLITLENVLVAPEDCVAYVGCSADWFWDLHLNGVKVADFMAGNDGDAHDVHAHLVPMLVKKGENRLVATMRRGSDGCTWSCRPCWIPSADRVLAQAVRHYEKQLENVYRVAKCRRRGGDMINDEGRAYLRDVIGLKTELDLRSDGECYGMDSSPAGPEVRWVHVSSGGYHGMRHQDAKEAFARDFRLFTDRSNYPIDFHCIAGQDRTGSLSFILLGLLGVSEEELIKDWEATCFWNRHTDFDHPRLDGLYKTFDEYPNGATLHEKIYLYVYDCGITPEEVKRFREIMLED